TCLVIIMFIIFMGWSYHLVVKENIPNPSLLVAALGIEAMRQQQSIRVQLLGQSQEAAMRNLASRPAMQEMALIINNGIIE
ncbi:hypothetical protein LCGC14_1565930, partial [marine sediment metagenome]